MSKKKQQQKQNHRKVKKIFYDWLLVKLQLRMVPISSYCLLVCSFQTLQRFHSLAEGFEHIRHHASDFCQTESRESISLGLDFWDLFWPQRTVFSAAPLGCWRYHPQGKTLSEAACKDTLASLSPSPSPLVVQSSL